MSKSENTLWFAQLNVFFWAPNEGSIDYEYHAAVSHETKMYCPFNLSQPAERVAADKIVRNTPEFELDYATIYGTPPPKFADLRGNVAIYNAVVSDPGNDEYIIRNGKKYKLVEVDE